MTDQAVAPARGDGAAAVVTQPESAGALLRRMRESSGVHLAVLASMMKVTPQKLDALEHDRLDQLPDVTFARGLAASICRAFGVDPAPILERMPKIAQGLHEPQGAGAGATFRRPGDDPAPLLSSGHSRVVLGVVVLLLLAAGLVWIWPTLPINLSAAPEGATAAGSQATPEEIKPGEPVAGQAATAGTGNAAETAANAGSGKVEAPADKPPAAGSDGAAAADSNPAEAARAAAASTAAGGEAPPAKAEAAPAESNATASAGPTAGPTAAAPADALALEASGESWVEVKDATGKILVNRTLKAGDKVQLNGALPFAVVIGRKDAVKASVHGEPFDLNAQGRGTVARFQVK